MFNNKPKKPLRNPVVYTTKNTIRNLPQNVQPEEERKKYKYFQKGK